MFNVFLIFCMIAVCRAQFPGTGPCKEMKYPDFDLRKYMGHWYIYANTWVNKPMGMCRQINYIPNGNSSKTLTETFKLIVPSALPIVEGVNNIEYLGDGNFFVLNSTDVAVIDRRVNILNTDYMTYAIRVVCQNVGQSSLNFAWVLTRSQHPSPSVLAQVDKALKADGLLPELFRRENQMDCPKYL